MEAIQLKLFEEQNVEPIKAMKKLLIIAATLLMMGCKNEETNRQFYFVSECDETIRSVSFYFDNGKHLEIDPESAYLLQPIDFESNIITVRIEVYTRYERQVVSSRKLFVFPNDTIRYTKLMSIKSNRDR